MNRHFKKETRDSDQAVIEVLCHHSVAGRVNGLNYGTQTSEYENIESTLNADENPATAPDPSLDQKIIIVSGIRRNHQINSSHF